MSMRSVYRKVAKQNGVSVKEVKSEIQKAIDAAWDNPDKSPEAASYQSLVANGGKKPSIEELIKFGAKEVSKK